MRSFLSISLLAIFALSPFLYSKSFHLFCLIDNEDASLGDSPLVDLKHMRKSFAFIASACKIPLKLKTLKSPELRKENIEALIQYASIDKDDVVIMYYSGHGGRTKNSPTIWPFGLFCDHKYRAEFSSIIDKLLSKGAALNIVLLDCCNSFTKKAKGDFITEEFHLKFETFNERLVAQGSNRLFLETKGLIISSGAVPGKAAENINGENQGGYFTSYFLERLFKEVHKPNPKWDRILEKTKLKVLSHTRRDPFTSTQTIQYKMLLSPTKKHYSEYRKFLYNDCKYVKSKELGQEDEEIRCFCGAYIDKAQEAIETNPTSEKVKTETTSFNEEIIEPGTEKLDF